MSLLIGNPLKFATPWYIARNYYGRCRIGYRDVVGFGINGSYIYKDDSHFPFPAIRFKENSRDIVALREKEKCDWKMLSCEEKKALYRASFCQTFVEFKHPTGQWKFVLGWVLLVSSFAFWQFMFFYFYELVYFRDCEIVKFTFKRSGALDCLVYDPLPESLSKTSQQAQLRRILELRMNPVDGISSKWDYDNDRWKK